MAVRQLPTEARIEEVIVRELKKIGREGGTALWWSIPIVKRGPIIGDMVDDQTVGVVFGESEEIDGGASMVHHWRAHFTIWMATIGERAYERVFEMKSDVVRALYLGEGAITAIANAGTGLPRFRYHIDQSGADRAFGSLAYYADFLPAHTDP